MPTFDLSFLPHISMGTCGGGALMLSPSFSNGPAILNSSVISLRSMNEADSQECTALHLGLRPLSRAYEQLHKKVKSEEEDLQRLADIWGSYRPTDGRPSSLRAGALRDFRKGYVIHFISPVPALPFLSTSSLLIYLFL